ncbi:PfkB family carbohydrate kinase [Microbacterium sp. RU33B]|uniref:PfkB family carbohydrate kinase n=1 Tax=Microbacterium sp. RU33B TaxID=1907390 RepID=UPI000962700B|nr:PfkB family carbohydrate kinase [Microbacterium sp. RU33B]SIT68180.1 ribokinase [Microbacterium sp. RU33B]
MTTTAQLTVVGAINLDLSAHVSRAPRPGETVADGSLARQPGGKGANQAVAAARLGAAVRLIGAVGDDDDGAAMITSLEDAGVEISGVQRAPEPTGTALIVVDAAGENSIVVCPGANGHIDVAEITVDPHTAVLAQLEVPAAVVEYVVARTDGFFALNASPAAALSAALRDRVDLFIVNETEYAALPDLRDARLTAVTLGAQGAVLFRNGEEIARASAPARAVVNTVGAGDSFAAALTLGLICGDDPLVALRRACAVGAAAVADHRSQPALGVLSDYPADA